MHQKSGLSNRLLTMCMQIIILAFCLAQHVSFCKKSFLALVINVMCGYKIMIYALIYGSWDGVHIW